MQIGIGLNSGEVVVRSISNDLNVDYSALGHTTHMAARMQELAAGGTTLMTASTLRQVEGFVQVKSVGAVQVKGVSRPVDAFEVVAATTARTRVQAAAVRGLTPLVGRRTEIEVFSKLVEEAASGKGQILAMVGEPGHREIAPGPRIYSTSAAAGLASAGGRIGFLRQGNSLFPAHRNVTPILPNRR